MQNIVITTENQADQAQAVDNITELIEEGINKDQQIEPTADYINNDMNTASTKN